MTMAICFNCAALKFGAFTPCEQCGRRPTEEDDLATAFALTDHRLSRDELEALSKSLQATGAKPTLDEAAMAVLRPLVRQLRQSFGILEKGGSN